MKTPRLTAFFSALLLLGATLFFSGPLKGQFHIRKSLPPGMISVGVASIDITPENPIRLSGYGSRTVPSEGIEQKLHAKALAMGEGTKESPLSVLITFDAIGIPQWVSDEVSKRLQKDVALPRAHLAVSATHSHTAPSLHGNLPFMFPSGLTDEENATIKSYTDQLLIKLESVAREAINSREPSRITWGKGKLGFAANRRVLENGKWKGFGVQKDGPVDHSFPLMRIENAEGETTAVFVNYACHCTTLGGNFNRVHGDWAGVAQAEIEQRHPGVTAMIAIGCGADQNPEPRGELDMAIAHGKAVADEVDSLLTQSLQPLTEAPQATYREIALTLEDPPARGVWVEQVRKKSKGYHFAEAMLEKLEAGEELESEISYPVQTWTFGDDLAMVFLGGEVVVDYALRFYEEFDPDRLWINAYSNAVPCYLPSKRLFGEGGYEVDYSMVYYGKPARLAFDTEDRIADEVMKQLPHPFYSAEAKKLLPAPVEKEQALATMRVADGFEVQLVAAEPLVQDPVDIAWDRQGRLWVVEMADYPTGIDGEPGGRVRVLEDTDEDGIYDKSTLFLEGLKYPNSVFPWRDGVLIVTADSILLAKDTDGDGRADETKPLFTGFESGNAQHQLGCLQWGLDNWVHVGNGDSKGSLTSVASGQSVELGARDLRFRPDTGEVETLSGKAQYGITRDDWGNWFGCSNSKPWWHYALDDTYLRRNPHIPYPDPKVLLGDEPIASPVFPASRTTSRFNDYDAANRFTSACGLHFFRDAIPGEKDAAYLFVSEPVHNLVSRVALSPDGTTFSANRLPREKNSEFFASTDNWCRPTSLRTGPDGALYVVDMYRLVIEHPEWIPENWQRRLNLREGHDRGRIYRISPKGKKRIPSPVPADLTTDDLVRSLDDRNGTRRDLIHRELLWRGEKDSIPHLQKLAGSANQPEARVQALAILDGLGGLNEAVLTKALSDAHPGVRRRAIRLAEPFLKEESPVLEKLLSLTSDSDSFVLQQLAYTLGESKEVQAGQALARILLRNSDDPFLRAAALSSALPHTNTLLAELAPQLNELPAEVTSALAQSLLGLGDTQGLATLLSHSVRSQESFTTLALLVETLERSGQPLEKLQQRDPALSSAIEKLDPLFATAQTIATTSSAPGEKRKTAIRLLGGSRNGVDADLKPLLSLLQANEPVDIQLAAVQRCVRLGRTSIASGILEAWDQLGSQAQSEVLNAMTSRQTWTELLLDYINTNPAIARSLSATQRASLLHNRDEGIRDRASALFSAGNSSRSEILARFQPSLTLEGNVDSGKQQFAALCATCHRIEETGFHVGPDLASLSNKSREALLQAIIDPNQAVEGKYALYTADTTDGTTLAGVMASETSTGVTLLGAGGIEQTALRNQIKSLNNTGLSPMPEGLEAALDPQKMADLLAYLGRTKTESRIVPDKHGSIRLTVAKASGEGPQVDLDPSTGALSWITKEDTVTWSVTSLPAGDYAIFYDAGLDAAEILSFDSFTLEIGGQAIHGSIEKSGGLNRLRKRQFGEVLIPQPLGETLIRFRHELPKGRVAIREIALIPRR